MKTELHKEIDGIVNGLKERGIEVKRSDVIESMAKARGHRNAHEMMAAEKKSKQSDDIHPFAEASETTKQSDADEHNALALRDIEIEQLREDIRYMEMRSVFDWVGWNKTIKAMKKASHFNKDPISDEDLELMRMAVSNNHCKSSASDRRDAEYKVMELAKKRMPAILARLDRAEELLGKGEIFTGPVLKTLINTLEVSANRDGDSFECYFLPDPESHLENYAQGVMLAAKSFSIDDFHTLMSGAEDISAEERAEELAADMDGCEVSPATLQINIAEAVEALGRGEGSILLHKELMLLARDHMGIDPRGHKNVIYPRTEG